jgi:hypothetical protein
MSVSDGPLGEMGTHHGRPDITDPLNLDDGTVERLLRGDITADDAPPSYQRVATLLTSLTADAKATELSGEGKAIDAISRRIAAAAPSTDAGNTKLSMKRRLQLVGVALVGGATLLSGLGVAGALPGAAQGVAADVLGTVGLSVPSPNSHSNGNADQRGHSAGHANTDNAGANTGANVSGTATDPSTTGLDKGAAVSSDASNGQSRAGQHDSVGAAPPAASGAPPVGTPPIGTPPVDTPPVTDPPVSTSPVSAPPVPTAPVSTPPVSVPSHP